MHREMRRSVDNRHASTVPTRSSAVASAPCRSGACTAKGGGLQICGSGRFDDSTCTAKGGTHSQWELATYRRASTAPTRSSVAISVPVGAGGSTALWERSVRRLDLHRERLSALNRRASTVPTRSSAVASAPCRSGACTAKGVGLRICGSGRFDDSTCTAKVGAHRQWELATYRRLPHPPPYSHAAFQYG